MTGVSRTGGRPDLNSTVNLIGGFPLHRGGKGKGGDSALLRITGIIVPIILDYALQVCMSQTEKNKQETSELFCTENIFTFANSSLQLRSTVAVQLRRQGSHLHVRNCRRTLEISLISQSTECLKRVALQWC
jgi:hypothetical protein